MSVHEVFEYAWVLVGALIMAIWQMLNGKIEHNHKNLNTRINETNEEVDRQRENMARIFEKLESHSRESTNRHIEILNYLRDRNH